MYLTIEWDTIVTLNVHCYTSLALKWNKLCGHEVEAPTTTFIVKSLVVQHWI